MPRGGRRVIPNMDEYRKKLSERSRWKTASCKQIAEWKAQLQETMRGNHYTPIEKISQMRKGKTHEEIFGSTKAKLMSVANSEAHKTMYSKDHYQRMQARCVTIRKLHGTFVHTELTKKILSEKLKGSRNANWRGGCYEPYSPEWNEILRSQIRDRDDHLCQMPACYLPENGRKHSVHHIDYDKKNSHSVNLIALCLGHNVKVNSNREHWTELFQELQTMRGI
jgi:hypothetical protein